MSATLPILRSVQQRLQSALPDIAVELFPDRPDTYRFIHPTGAVLIAWQDGKYGKLDDVGFVVQERTLVLYFTIFSRNLYGEMGGLYLSDALRLSIAGFRPTDCTPCHCLDDGFLAETSGVWQHYLRVQTETEQVQATVDEDLPKFIRLRLREYGDPLEPDLKPAALKP